MKLNRRKFVKQAALGSVGTAFIAKAGASETYTAPTVLKGKDDRFVRLGWIGIGRHGAAVFREALKLSYVKFPALCDINKDNLERAMQMVTGSGRPRPEGYGEHEESFRDMVNRDDLDGIVIFTPWEWHIPMAIAAMEAGKYASVEAGPANSVEECWDLVKTFERTRKPCMLTANHCYERWNMAVLNMARKGIFGELIHAKAGYFHDLRPFLVTGVRGDEKEVKYRALHNQFRNGDLYPSHGIGPISHCFNILRGNKFIYLTSTASKSRGLSAWAKENLPEGHPRRDLDFRIGDIISTVIKCQNGETIDTTHDTRLLRPRSTPNRVMQGTKAIFTMDKEERDKASIYIDGRSPERRWEDFAPYQEEFEHPLWKRYLREGVQSPGSHFGCDYLKIRGFAEAIKRQAPTSIDTYDTATWKAIGPLTEKSIALGSAPVDFPDFTNGRWFTNIM